MVYSKKFVAVVVCDGKILRERRNTNSSEDSVNLPFGSDFSLRLKNLDSRRASVSIQIDGQDVLANNRIIVDGNDSIDLKGFMENDGTVKNAFRFIQKTQEIVEHRGDRIDDGFIRIEWQWEKVKIVEDIIHEHHHHNYYDYYDYWHQYPWITRPHRYDPYGPYWTSGEITYGGSGTFGSNDFAMGNNMNVKSNVRGSSCGNINETPPMKDVQYNINDDEGITVKGAQTNQNWHNAWIGELEEAKNTIIIKLTGIKRTKHQVKEDMDDDYKEQKFRDFKEKKIPVDKILEEEFDKYKKKYEEKTKLVKEPLYVNTKIKCPTCGRNNRSGNRFCYNCGSNIEI